MTLHNIFFNNECTVLRARYDIHTEHWLCSREGNMSYVITTARHNPGVTDAGQSVLLHRKFLALTASIDDGSLKSAECSCMCAVVRLSRLYREVLIALPLRDINNWMNSFFGFNDGWKGLPRPFHRSMNAVDGRRGQRSSSTEANQGTRSARRC